MVEAVSEVRTSRPNHVSRQEALAQVAALREGEVIDAACAVTVASWWASPGSQGRAFAQLVTTGTVPVEAMCEDLLAAMSEVLTVEGASSPDFDALIALGDWVIHQIYPDGGAAARAALAEVLPGPWGGGRR